MGRGRLLESYFLFAVPDEMLDRSWPSHHWGNFRTPERVEGATSLTHEFPDSALFFLVVEQMPFGKFEQITPVGLSVFFFSDLGSVVQASEKLRI